MRREVGILSKLKHCCIIAFIGVCVQPQLLVVMEFAPLGSLRKVLEAKNSELLEEELKVVTPFERDLTFKIIYQVNKYI